MDIEYRGIEMGKFLYETHCHTDEVSTCARVAAKDVVENYIRAGYSGIVVTDHFNRHTFLNKPGLKTSQMAEYYLTGYRAAKQAAADRLTVILGMELTFYENDNDYLVYGVTEAFIHENPNMMELGLERFSALAHENGMVIFQAHPFRNRMTVMPPDLLDGAEVHNGNPRHDSRNDIARMWAEKFGKKMSSGSDYHQTEDLARGGIVTKEPLYDAADIARVLMQGEAELIEATQNI